ncbi:MAG: hypothetical protein CXT73_05890 [Methanobacteriota archaeon]|nr:MAG: hypothetical protein CXT73_05890 [Euryarchaeota archaeon]
MTDFSRKRKREDIEEDTENPFNKPIKDDSFKKPKTTVPANIKEAASKTFQLLSQRTIDNFLESRENAIITRKKYNDELDTISEQITKDASTVSEDLVSAASSSSEASEASEVKTVFTVMTRLSKMSWDSTMKFPGDNDDKKLNEVMDSFQRTKQEFDEGYKNTLNDELKTILEKYMPEDNENDGEMMTRLTSRSMTTIKTHYKTVFGEYGIIFNKYKKDHSALHEAFFHRLYSGELSGTEIDKQILKTSLVSDLNRWASCVTLLSWRTDIPFFYKYDLKSDPQPQKI